MWSLAIAVTMLAAGPTVEVRTLDGKTASGQIVELSAERLVLQTPEGQAPLNTSSLVMIRSKAAEATDDKSPAAAEIELTDETRLVATGYQASKGTAKIALAGGTELQVPTGAVRWVRFRDPGQPDETLARQWKEILRVQGASDLIVVRKADSIDSLEGVLREVDAETVHFEVDGDTIPVKRPKVEGIVYYHAAGAKLPDARCQVEDAHGSSVQATSIALTEGKWKATTPSGVELTWPLESIRSIDYSSGKIAYLSDLEPQSVKYVPYFEFNEELPALAAFYQPRRDTSLNQTPLKLDGATFAKGIALHSGTTVEYRLPRNFRRFQAVAGIDDSVPELGEVRLKIVGDGKPLWEGTVRGTDPPQTIELEIDGVNRLQLVADYGERQDIAGHLNLGEARVTK